MRDYASVINVCIIVIISTPYVNNVLKIACSGQKDNRTHDFLGYKATTPLPTLD